jgi:hypothetical protein
MKRTSVSSGNIASVGYDAKMSIMEVEFTTGDVYKYYDVPVDVYRGLMDAESKGVYLYSNVKSKYQYSKV